MKSGMDVPWILSSKKPFEAAYTSRLSKGAHAQRSGGGCALCASTQLLKDSALLGRWGEWYVLGSPNFHVALSGIAEILGRLGVLLGGAPYHPGWVGPWSANALFALRSYALITPVATQF